MARTPKMTEDRREQIIDAALRVFAEKGFAHATNSEIAREAGNMTPGLIYYYFKSKEDLLKVVLQERSPLRARRRSIQRCWGCRQILCDRSLQECTHEELVRVLLGSLA